MLTPSCLFYAGACEGQMPEILSMVKINKITSAPPVIVSATLENENEANSARIFTVQNHYIAPDSQNDYYTHCMSLPFPLFPFISLTLPRYSGKNIGAWFSNFDILKKILDRQIASCLFPPKGQTLVASPHNHQLPLTHEFPLCPRKYDLFSSTI